MIQVIQQDWLLATGITSFSLCMWSMGYGMIRDKLWTLVIFIPAFAVAVLSVTFWSEWRIG